MTDLAQLAEKIVGLMYLVMGLSLVIRTKDWVKFSDEFLKNKTQIHPIVFFALPFGLFIVLVHNQWEWSPSVIVTLLGWIAVIKSVLFLLHPKILFKFMPKRKSLSQMIALEGIVITILSAWVVHNAFD